MNTILWIFIAVAFGLMLFVSIQGEIPDEISFLKADPAHSATPVLKDGSYSIDNVVVRVGGQGAIVEVTAPFDTPLMSNGAAVGTPSLSLLCNAGALDVKVDTALATTGVNSSKVKFNGYSNSWQKGEGFAIFPPNPDQIKGFVKYRDSLIATFSYTDLGLQEVTLNTASLKNALTAAPTPCWN